MSVLFSRTQPLIRYELSDRVQLATDTCACGMPYRRINAIQGRAEDVVRTLDALAPDRLGHGVRASEDPELLAEVVRRGIALEVCPGSNVALGVYSALDQVPLRALLDAGATVALGADDPLLFGSRLADQYVAARDVHGLEAAALGALARASFAASRAPREVVEAAERDIVAWVAAG